MLTIYLNKIPEGYWIDIHDSLLLRLLPEKVQRFWQQKHNEQHMVVVSTFREALLLIRQLAKKSGLMMNVEADFTIAGDTKL